MYLGTILSSKGSVTEWTWGFRGFCCMLDKMTVQVLLALIAGVASRKRTRKGLHVMLSFQEQEILGLCMHVMGNSWLYIS